MSKDLFKTEKRTVKELVPYKFNPRKMREDQVEALKKSLEKFGLVELPVIDADGTIVAGHQRLKVMMMIGRGEDEIEVRVAKRKLTDEEFQHYNIASNKVSGEWDWDTLANHFDFDLLQEAGFSEQELLGRKEVKEDEFDTDAEIEKIGTPTVQLGDMYKLGEHRIICGDATDPYVVTQLMGGQSAKMIFTSPPYNMDAGLYGKEYGDNKKREEYIAFNINTLNAWKQHLKGYVFWNISYNKNARDEFIEIMYRILKETGLKFLELIVWNKKHAMPISSKAMLTRQYEDVLLVGSEDEMKMEIEMYFAGTNEKQAVFNKRTGRGVSNYWEIGTNKSQQSVHLACFPVNLPAKGIELMTLHGDIVADPFLGSGTTLIAAEQLGRKCYGTEMSPLFVELAIKRWEAFTGKKAEKIA